MRPLSRGTDPIEFTLRMVCEIGQQFSFSGALSSDFMVGDVRCNAACDNARLVITATRFSDVNEATCFFHTLQHLIASVSLQERVAISIPPRLSEPVEAAVGFMEHDDGCVAHGWPDKSIRPLLIPNFGASVYPEHKFVAIEESMRFVPSFSFSLESFVEKITVKGNQADRLGSSDETLLLAISSYTQAARSTQWVWSFLLAIMTLEMLAIETPTNDSTRAAVKALIEQANAEYKDMPSVDLGRIRSSLNQANHVSKKASVRALVKEYCGPGGAGMPPDGLFLDDADCDRKVGAMYDIRSTYVHEGRIKPSTRTRYSFDDLRNTALASLGRILQVKLMKSAAVDD